MSRRAKIVGLLTLVFYVGALAGVAIKVEWDWIQLGRNVRRRAAAL